MRPAINRGAALDSALGLPCLHDGPSSLLVTFQLPLAPMRLLAIGVELTHHATVQRIQYADARQHEPGAAGLCGTDRSTAICDISRSCSAFGSSVM
jgi:hypothetical protein